MLPRSTALRPPSAAAPAGRWETAAVIGALFLVSAFIYAQTIGFGFLVFDDPGYARDNPHVHAGLTAAGVRWAFTSCEFSNWHPLTWLSLMLDGQLFRGWAGGFHLTNVLLHFANGVLLFLWLRTATRPAGFTALPAAAVALLFIAHPMHVESVAWVTERKDVLSTLFFLLTLVAYTGYVRRAGTRAGRWRYALALASLALGLMAKPMLVTAPAVLLLLDYWPLRRWAFAGDDAVPTPVPLRRLLWEKVPFILLAVASAAVTWVVQRNAKMPLAALPLTARLQQSASAVGEYLLKTIWPLDLAILYRFPNTVSPGLLAGGALALGLGSALAWKFRRSSPWLLVGWLWFLGTLVPVIGLVQVGNQRIADRYVYLPHIGLFIAVCFLAVRAFRKVSPGRPGLRLPAVLGVCFVAALAVRSRDQTSLWRDNVTLFENALDINGADHYLSNRLLAQSHLEAGNLAQTRVYADAALRLLPTEPAALDLAATVRMLGSDWEGAVPLLARLAAAQPARSATFEQLGIALSRTGRMDGAKAALQRALELTPATVSVRLYLARVLLELGDTAAGAAQLEAVLAIQPEHRLALHNLAWLRATSADAGVRDSHRALELARRIAAVDGPGTLAALDCQAAAYAGLGRWAEASAAAREALARARESGSPEETARHGGLLQRYENQQPF